MEEWLPARQMTPRQEMRALFPNPWKRTIVYGAEVVLGLGLGIVDIADVLSFDRPSVLSERAHERQTSALQHLGAWAVKHDLCAPEHREHLANYQIKLS